MQLKDHNLVPPTRDAQELQGLHRHLFQDVYDWAGEYRIIDMRIMNGQHFAPCTSISFGISHLMNNLSEQDFLRGLPREDFLSRLTEFYDLLNYIHPIREGNGRTQRVFGPELLFQRAGCLTGHPYMVKNSTKLVERHGKTQTAADYVWR